MTKIIKIFIFHILFLPYTLLHAQFYFNIGEGLTFTSTHSMQTKNSSFLFYSPTSIGISLFTLPNVNWHNDFHNGFNFNAAIGYKFTENWHSSIEFLYQNIQRQTYGDYGWQEIDPRNNTIYAGQGGNPISNIKSRANLYNFFTNINYDFSVNQFNLIPFVNFGIGLSKLQAHTTTSDNVINIDDPRTPIKEIAQARQISPNLYGNSFAGQLKIGLIYKLSDMTDLLLQYRLTKTSNFRASTSKIVINPGTDAQSNFYIGQYDFTNILTQAIELNLRFNL